MIEKCSSETPHAAHTFGGRPMQLCKGIPKPDCDGLVIRATGQCNMCLAYHESTTSTEPKMEDEIRNRLSNPTPSERSKESITDFIYLLNMMENAAQQDVPYNHGYADKRQAVIAFVRNLVKATPSEPQSVAQVYSDPDKVDPPPSQDGESHEPTDGGEGTARYEESIQHRTKESYILCKHCDCPMLPPGVKKLPNEYDHAQGCPNEGKDASGNLIATASLDGGARQAEVSDEHAPGQIEALIQGHVNNEAISPDLLRGFANDVWQIATRDAFGKAAEVAEEEGKVPREEGGSISRWDACDNVAARLRQMQGKP